MNKELLELLELLKELNGVLENAIKEDKSKNKGSFRKAIDKAFKEKVIISLEKSRNGETKIHTEGSKLGVLISLAGLEKGILETTKVPTPLWEYIKHTVGTKDAKTTKEAK